MRCGRCGNDNAEGNRFCGMCGAPLVANTQSAGASAGRAPTAPGQNIGAPHIATPRQAPAPVASAQAPSVSRQSVPAQTVARTTPPASTLGPAAPGSGAVERPPVTLSSFEVARDEPDSEPIISGPSFLGLNKPSARRGFRSDSRMEGGRDQLRSSGNVDYLLDDEEEPKRGWGKLIFFVVALALAGGFGYLHWQQGGFEWLKAGDKKPAAAQSTPEVGQSGADSGVPSGAAAPAATTPAASNGQAASGAPAAKGAPGAATPAPAEGSVSQGNPTPAAPAASQPAPTALQAAPPATDAGPPGSSAASPVTGSQNAASGASAPSSASNQASNSNSSPSSNSDSDSEEQEPDQEQPATTKAANHTAAAAKPIVTKPSPAKRVDPVIEAERYIYGSGVPQDCDRGLRMMKSAAGQSDAKAMISLGALYSTGTCAPRDLPTAYRWFAMALHKQPDNQVLQSDLQKLWSQMTQPERQLAIKLSQ